jgi:hypothetical protein
VAALKAVSQNLIHENLSITDGVYGILSDVDVRSQIAMLGEKSAADAEIARIIEFVQRELLRGKNKP